MKIIKITRCGIVLAAIFFVGTTQAFEVGGAREYCKPPKFRDFFPPKRSFRQPFVVIDPTAEIAFKVTGSVDPSSIRVFAKKIPLTPTIVDKKSFFEVTASLPAGLTTRFARIDLIAHARDRECTGKDGWLVKLKKVDAAE